MKENNKSNRTIYISSKAHLNLTFNLLQCGLQVLDPGEKFAIGNSNDSNTFTLVYIEGGQGKLVTADMPIEVGEAQGFWAFPEVCYELNNCGANNLTVIWLSFTGYLVEHYLNRANIMRKAPVFNDPDRAINLKIRNFYEASQIMPNRYCRMASILYDIFSALLDANPNRVGEIYDYDADLYAIKAIEYIEQNYARVVSAEKIAAALGISRKHLYAVFNDILKISPKQYLIYYRLEKACLRLRTTKQPIQEIAAAVGYANQFYFAREFKRLIGQTPSAYRKWPGQQSEMLSYLSFVSTVRERLTIHPAEAPVKEQILSVYMAPQPIETEQ